MSKVEVQRVSLRGINNGPLDTIIQRAQRFNHKVEAYASKEGFIDLNGHLDASTDSLTPSQMLGSLISPRVWIPKGWQQDLLPDEFLIRRFEQPPRLVLVRHGVDLPIENSSQLDQALGNYFDLFAALYKHRDLEGSLQAFTERFLIR